VIILLQLSVLWGKCINSNEKYR